MLAQVVEQYCSMVHLKQKENVASIAGRDWIGVNDMGKRDKNELIIHIMHGYDSLEAPTGESCFGCYMNGKYEIYVADNIPTDQLFHTIAHEYMHYLQDIDGKEFDEKEANDFAWSVFTPCYQQGLKDAREKAIDEFVAEAMKDFTDFDLRRRCPTVTDYKAILRDVAERMKNE